MTTRPRSKLLIRTLIPVISIVALVLIALSFLDFKRHSENSADGHAEIALGMKLEDFTIAPFKGEPEPLSKDGASVRVINFWATWCAPCVIEMPSLAKLHARYKDRGVKVYAVSVDEDPEGAIPGFLKKMKLDLPVYVDVEQKLSSLFDVHALPFTVILDRDLKVLHFESGERDWDSSEVRASIEKWLK